MQQLHTLFWHMSQVFNNINQAKAKKQLRGVIWGKF